MSPIANQMESITQNLASMNGRPRSPSAMSHTGSVSGSVGGQKDSFLNYFFGKEGAQKAAQEAATPRSAPSEFQQSLKRQEMATTHIPQHVTAAAFAAQAAPPPPPERPIIDINDPPTFVSNFVIDAGVMKQMQKFIDKYQY